MSQIDEAKELLKYFQVHWEGIYNRQLTVNAYKEKWAFVDIIDSVGVGRAKELIEYYFTVTKPGHPLQWFYYNFDRLDKAMVEKQKDRNRRQILKEQTQERVMNEQH